jgi:DNA-binding CsgD family transcriptional regulator
MVRSSDGALAFRHELARHAFEDSLSPLRQISLHERVLSVLEQRQGIPPARLAHHANGARNASEVLRFAPIAAAHAVSVGAHRQAAAHYEVALRYAENLPAEDRAKLHERLAYECYLTDQADRAVEARTVALEIWRSLGERLKEGDNLRWLSRLTWFAGHRAEADRYGVEAVEVLEGLAPGPELAMAYSNRAQLAMLAQEPHAAIEWAQRTITLAETLHNNEILSHALNNLGTSRLILLEEEGWADLNRSLQLALAGGFQEHVARAYTNLSYRAFEQRRFAEATRYLSAGIAYCEEHDLDSWRLYMLAGSARSKFDQGDWNTASEEAEAVLRHPRTAAISRIPALIVLGHVRVLRGDPDAESPLEEARALAGRTEEVQRICPLAAALAEAAWHAGDTARVVREVQPAYDLVRELRDPWLEGEMAVWLKRADALTHPPNDPPEPYALELSGDYIGAARAWGELGCPYEQARMLASTVTEREQLEALATFDRMGATPAAQALRRQMRSQGVRGVPRGARTSTRSHPQGLTEREVEILGLLSDGLRNSAIAKRLFLSTRTVDHHVSSILTKLGVPSRAEAIAMARRRRDGGS